MLRWSGPQWGVLLALVVVVVFSGWLGGESSLQMQTSSASLPGGFEAKGIRIAQYEPNGAVRYLLQAKRMHQYGEGKPTDLDLPLLESYDLNGVTTHFDAPLAQWYEDSDVLKFPQYLQVNRPSSAQYLALNFTAADVTLNNKQQRLTGNAKVSVRYGLSTLEAQGVTYDWATRQLVLKSKVRMVYAKPR